MKNISIVGFGRFGKLLYEILSKDFSISIYDSNDRAFNKYKLSSNTKVIDNIKDIYQSDTIFYAVPISQFEKVIEKHSKYFNDEHVLIDVLSVKLQPKKVLEKYLVKTKTQAILTHPMFGPDSVKMKGLEGRPMIMDKFRSKPETYKYWKNYFSKKGINIVEMTAKQHDILASKSQGITHFIGRLLEQYDLKPTSIDTEGAKLLYQVMSMTSHDSFELFMNLQNYNPYTKKMRLELGSAYDKLYNKLLPQKINNKYIIFGIQGGKGSFNEQALLDYVKRHDITKYKIKYLYTTEKVLNNLHKGNIDYGQFAIHNSVGGIVNESIKAIAKYKFEIIEEFAIKIRHFLMKRKDVDVSKITTIMAHDQVLKQCHTNLEKKYPKLKQITGTGDLLDTATAARALSLGKIDKNRAILGPQILAQLFDFDIIDQDLQDNPNNLTSFLMVKR